MPRKEQTGQRTGHHILNVPNALTLLRLAMVPLLVALLLAGADGLAAGVMALAAATDFFDGRLARRRGPTLLGQILDPVADRVLISGVAVVLAVRGLLPVWAVAILVGRDALALVGSCVYGNKVRVNPVGKAATVVLMAAVVLVVFGLGRMGIMTFYAGICLSIAAGFMYLLKILEILGGGEAR